MFYPEMHICFETPFFEHKLKSMSKGVDKENYLKYLRGEVPFKENYTNIEFSQISLNLFDHIEELNIIWKNLSINMCTDLKNCPFVFMKNNFNGFGGTAFWKCFGIELSRQYAKDVAQFGILFNGTWIHILKQIGQVFLGINYPGQFYRSLDAKENIWPEPEKDKTVDTLTITSIEILRRRNKKSDPCLSNWRNYDDILLWKHIRNAGCRAPYQKPYRDFHICKTQEEMKKSLFDWQKLQIGNLPLPCQEIPDIPFKHTRRINGETDEYIIWINYPRKVKLIKQSRSVDIHALIGNIGGYIGLFLGKCSINILPNLKRLK